MSTTTTACQTLRAASSVNTLAWLSLLLGGLGLLTGCVTSSVRTVDLTPPEQMLEEVDEEFLLDVGVAIFDPSLPEDIETQIELGVVPGVRTAEASFMPYFLKTLLQSTGNWGAVRVVPRWSNAVDLTVLGRIIESNGEFLKLNVGVVDATGRIWFNKDYETFASKYAYESWMPDSVDPFQPLYKEIANDLITFYAELTADDISYVRRVAQLRFAQEMAPEAYATYLVTDDQQRVVLKRLPAVGDPMLDRIQRVREREYLFIDTLDEHYAAFYGNMRRPYQDYRQATYDEAVEIRELQAKARARRIMGATAIAGGLAAQLTDNWYQRVAGGSMVYGGAQLLKDAFAMKAETKLHVQTMEQLGQSLETELMSHSMELENETLKLTGTVDEQFAALRKVLKRLHREDLGLPTES